MAGCGSDWSGSRGRDRAQARRWRRNRPGNAQAKGPRRPRNAGKQGVSACALAEGARRSPSHGRNRWISQAPRTAGVRKAGHGGPSRHLLAADDLKPCPCDPNSKTCSTFTRWPMRFSWDTHLN